MRIADEEIEVEQDPVRAMLLALANERHLQIESGEPHVPRLNEDGWSISFQTDKGIVGVQSSWLRNRFTLCYPHDVPFIYDGNLQNTLGVSFSKPVADVLQTVVSRNSVDHDRDKPLRPIPGDPSSAFAYKSNGYRRWAMFYSEPCESGGRVWIDHSGYDTSSHHFEYVNKGNLRYVQYGHDRSMTVATYPFSAFNEYAPDGPTSSPEEIQKYRYGFIALAMFQANQMGGAHSVTINYQFLLSPHHLDQLGYKVREHAGMLWGTNRDQIVILKRGNSLVPWSTYRHEPLKNQTPVDLLTF